jgi:glycosyltransferase involved in cell wall biosynthesis
MLLDRLTSGGGGAEVFTTGLAAALPRDRFDVRLCVTRYAEGFLVDQLRSNEIPLLALGRRSSRDVLPFWRLRDYLREEGIEVLHTHLFGSNLWGSLVGRSAGVPAVIAHEHTWSYEGQPLRKFLDGRVIGRLANAFIAVSRRDGERMVALERVPADKVDVIPAAFVPRENDPEADLRAELGISRGARVIGTAVGLRPQKALDVAIDAFSRVFETMPDAHFVVAGDGRCSDAWERHAHQIGVSERVHFIGPRSDIAGIIGSFDVATLSSDFEGTPVFLLEAMAYGAAIAATDVGGVRDVVGGEETALLVPPRDPEALGAAYLALLGDPDRRAKMTRAAKDRLEEFSIERVSERIARLYESLLPA